ncbi:MAG: hypothetical protein U0169_06325 [Polyangiaceae bacterium]
MHESKRPIPHDPVVTVVTVPVRTVSRRQSLGVFGALGGAFLFGCGGSSTGDGTSGSGGGGGASGTGGTAGTSGTSGTAGTSGTSDASVAAGAWATGGTKSMSGTYADPFTAAITSCALAVTATEGPCTEAADQVRKDISEGYTGLPVRLAFKVVDASCNVIAGAKVKIWHTQVNGSYSGDTPNNGMCLKDSADSAKHYFRGVQTTDARGRVDFDTCFPGWYRGRAIHIHFTVSLNGKSYTSQLAFDQTVIQDVFANHSEYKSFGQPDTPNATDNIVGGANLPTFLLDVSRLDDGAMMAAKVLVVNV